MVSQQQFYQCALNVKSMRDVVRYVGTITCRGMTFSALPETVQQQAQLMLTRHGKAVDATVMNTDNDVKGK
jgi:hypothetical protein